MVPVVCGGAGQPQCPKIGLLGWKRPPTRAAESESEPESESFGVGCFSRSRSRSRSRQNLPTPTDSEQALIPDSMKSPYRLFDYLMHFSVHISVVDWLDDRYRTQPCAALHSRTWQPVEIPDLDTSRPDV